MKKVATLAILIVFLLNSVGFYGILIGLQFKFASEVNKQLDEDQYSASEAITFSVPMAIPYSIEEQDFHRVTVSLSIKAKFIASLNKDSIRIHFILFA
jgi:hypothetical protein